MRRLSRNGEATVKPLLMFNCIALITALCTAWSANAEISLPAIIDDHMVLQRQVNAPIWGWADPNESVTVSVYGPAAYVTGDASGRWQKRFGPVQAEEAGDTLASGMLKPNQQAKVHLKIQERSVTADENGLWNLVLEPLRAGGPLQIEITCNHERVTVSDVLVGEVWICSGQSNMDWMLKNTDDAEAVIAAASHPEIRLMRIERAVADKPQRDAEGYWTTCTPKEAETFSAVAYYFGRKLHEDLGVPIGLIKTAWGGTPVEAWTSSDALGRTSQAEPTLKRWDGIVANYPEALKAYGQKHMEWQQAVAAAKAAGETPPREPRAPQGPDHHHRPASLYNAMIMPLVPYAFQGAIWYQGESNASRAHQYQRLFPLMIDDWRDTWRKEFPFYFVQLANYRERKEQPADSDWAELREAQTMSLGLPKTGMAVIIDIGEADDIHPRNKKDVGERLALNALAQTYGKDIPYSGPMFKDMAVDGNEIRITFDHSYEGLEAKGGELRGFAIAGEDRQFVWADARIDGETVIVSNPEVQKPVAVRYAWADNPEATLYNSAALPASPFRTDDWPGVTEGNY
jgi:sialate O-acetylesterase